MEIKSYMRDPSVLKTMQSAIDTICTAEKVFEKMSRICNKWGLQGQKRYNIMQADEARCKRMRLQYHTIDQFGEDVEIEPKHNIVTPKNIEEYFELYLDYATQCYQKLNDIANDLTIKGYGVESNMVREYLPCLSKFVEKLRRWILDYSKANWDWSYVRICDNRLHDKIKNRD